MQGLPFDENDFPAPPSSGTTTWMDHSPRLIPATNQNTTVEELYGIVAGQPSSHSHGPNSDAVQRFSQQAALMASSNVPMHVSEQMPHSFHNRRQHPNQALPQHSQAQLWQQPPLAPDLSNHRNTNAFLTETKNAVQHSNQSQCRQRAPMSQAEISPQPQPSDRIVPTTNPVLNSGALPVKRGFQQHSRQPLDVSQAVDPRESPLAVADDCLRKPVRSAVEEARIRAQREAETFANSRRGPAKKEASLAASTLGSHSDQSGKDSLCDRRSMKRHRHSNDKTTDKETARTGSSRLSPTHDKVRQEDDLDVEKQERYKRRLDMNRESAAVSRVRRRAYVKELEERLATVEAEKLQLEGKLEIMMSQNESFKKQLDSLFMMVTNRARPPFNPQPPPPNDGS